MGRLVVLIVLVAAEQRPAGEARLAARQMHAAVLATHHVLPSCALWRALVPVAPAIRLQHPVDQEQDEDQQYDFGQARAPVTQSALSVP